MRMTRFIDSFSSRQASIRSDYRHACRSTVAYFPLIFLLQACTTPNHTGRLIFQRGATQLPTAITWLDFDGQIAIQPPFDRAPLNDQIKTLIQTKLVPRNTGQHRALKLQSVIIGCQSKPNPSCGARVVVEVVGSDNQTILRAMEGIAELNLARPADLQTVSRALSTLFETAVDAAVRSPEQRPPPVSKMERLIRQGSTEKIQDWTRRLEDQDTSEIQRINLWIALGHVANPNHLERLKTIQPRNDREAQVRSRALRWIDAASPDAGKSRPAHVKYPSGKGGERP